MCEHPTGSAMCKLADENVELAPCIDFGCIMRLCRLANEACHGRC